MCPAYNSMSFAYKESSLQRVLLLMCPACSLVYLKYVQIILYTSPFYAKPPLSQVLVILPPEAHHIDLVKLWSIKSSESGAALLKLDHCRNIGEERINSSTKSPMGKVPITFSLYITMFHINVLERKNVREQSLNNVFCISWFEYYLIISVINLIQPVILCFFVSHRQKLRLK